MSPFILEERKARCPNCNGRRFVRSVRYELYQSIDEDGNIIDDDPYTWDNV
jgi:Ribonuclease G/E